MGKKATGSEITLTSDGIRTARVSVDGRRETFTFPTARTDEAAIERREQVAALAKRMILAGTDRELALDALRKVALAPAGRTLLAASIVVDKLVGGWRPPQSTCPTFNEIAEEWLTGALYKRFPKQVRFRKTTGAARANLRKYVRPLIGDMPVDQITLEDCSAILNGLGHLRDNSTRQITAPLCTILDYCVQPLGLIERSPIPPKWQPKEGDTRALQWLYPSEDAKLMACAAVPLWARLYFGYLLREGGRESEPIVQACDQFFEDGRDTSRLYASQTKTRKARFWQLAPGTARALRAMHAMRGALPTHRAFVNASGRRIEADGLPELLRASLRLAGVTRRELFETTDESRQICPHDLRRTFVTVKLALVGPDGSAMHNERWIMARTGHETSEEIRTYTKDAQNFAELNVGDFLPLDEAIPELSQNIASVSAKHAETLTSQYSIVELPPIAEALEMTKQSTVTQNAPAHMAPFDATSGDSAARIAALEARLEALSELVAGDFAKRIAGAVVGELQREGVVARPSLHSVK